MTLADAITGMQQGTGRVADRLRHAIREGTLDGFFLLFTLSLFLKSVVLLSLALHRSHDSFDPTNIFFFRPSLLVYLAVCLAWCSPALLLPGRARLGALFALDVAATFLFVVDAWNYRAFSTFATVYHFQATGNLHNMKDSVVSMVRPVDFVFLLDFPLLAWLAWRERLYFARLRVALVGMLVLQAGIVGYLAWDHHQVDIVEQGQNRILFRVCWAPVQTLSNLSPLGYHAYDALMYYTERQRQPLAPEECETIRSWFEKKNAEKLPDNRYRAMLQGRNLLIVQVESLEAFPLGQRIHGQEITPHLNRLLSQGLSFADIHEQVNSGTSSDSDLMVNTSIYPIRSGTAFFRYPDNLYHSLPKLLEARGYSTAAYHPDRGGYWNSSAGLRGVGFQQVIDVSAFTIDEHIGIGISDGSYLRQLRPMLRRLKRPFYAFCVTITSHGPFDIDAAHRELKLPPALDKTRLGGYFQSLRYTDRHVGLLLEGLQKDGLLQDTVVVVEGDHGGMHKFYRDELEAMTPQEPWWKDEHSHVPLIVWARGMKPARVTLKGGQIDIMPTLCYLMGIPEEQYVHSAMGRNLLKTRKSFAVLSDGTFLGEPRSEKDHAVQGLEVADKILRSNYFKYYDRQ